MRIILSGEAGRSCWAQKIKDFFHFYFDEKKQAVYMDSCIMRI